MTGWRDGFQRWPEPKLWFGELWRRDLSQDSWEVPAAGPWGDGGTGGTMKMKTHWETHMYSYYSSALFSLSLLLIITSSINSTDSGSVTLLVTISCIRRWIHRKKTNKQTITLTRQNTYRIRGELQRVELNRGLKNLQHDQKQSLLCQCWHVLLHFLLILFHSQIPLPKLQ